MVIYTSLHLQFTVTMSLSGRVLAVHLKASVGDVCVCVGGSIVLLNERQSGSHISLCGTVAPAAS